MKEKTILRLAIIITIIGILSLFGVFQLSDIKESDLSSVNDMTDISILISGKVSRIIQTNSSTFITIEKTEKTTIVVFDKAPPLAEGDMIQVRGKSSENKGQSTVLAEEIRKI